MATRKRKPSLNWEANLGEQVRLWRVHLGLKQSELEERAGLAHNAVSRIEKGDVSPRLETLEKLAGALGISVEELQFRVPLIEKRSETERWEKTLLEGMHKLGDEDRKRLLEIFHALMDLLEQNR